MALVIPNTIFVIFINSHANELLQVLLNVRYLNWVGLYQII